MDPISPPPESTQYPVADARREHARLQSITNTIVSNSSEAIKTLLEQEWTKTYRAPQSGRTLLHIAAHMGAVEAAAQLLVKGFDLQAQDSAGNTPLHLAVGQAFHRVALMLIDAGADVKPVNQANETALHVAAASSGKEVICALIERGTGPNDKEFRGRNALHIAAKKGSFNNTLVLIEKGADILAKDDAGNTPFYLAMKAGNDRVAQLLAAAGGADSRAKAMMSKTFMRILLDSPLRNAIKTRNTTVLRLCLDRHPEIAKEDLKWAKTWYAKEGDDDGVSANWAIVTAHMAKHQMMQIASMAKHSNVP